jgi:hypothetical protein
MTDWYLIRTDPQARDLLALASSSSVGTQVYPLQITPLDRVDRSLQPGYSVGIGEVTQLGRGEYDSGIQREPTVLGLFDNNLSVPEPILRQRDPASDIDVDDGPLPA